MSTTPAARVTPVTTASPTAPASYSWEATNEEVAARYGVPEDRIVRFDLNTSPAAPSLAFEVLAAGRFATPLNEYPPSDYRRLTEAAAERYGVAADELLVGAGADEILDIAGKAFLPAGGRAVLPTPTYAMYRVITEQRAAEVIPVPRRSADEGWGIDLGAVREAARDADVVWLCSPNNPTGLAEPEGAIELLLDGLERDAIADRRQLPVVVLDEAYAEFVGQSMSSLRRSYPRLVVVRTASKAYALAGLRVGFAIAAPETIAEMALFRPPGSVATTSVTVVTEALRTPDLVSANVARVERERRRLTDALRDVGWDVGPSVTNFLLADLRSAEHAAATAEALLRRGLVPRTFPFGHPLAAYLRVTVRDAKENDRLVSAAQAAAEEADA